MTDSPPPFVLKREDKLAPMAMSYWIWCAEREGVNRDKLQRARDHLAAVLEWQAANPDKVKVPD